MSIMFEYLDEHKEVLLRDNLGCNELWLANEHMKKFIGWLRDRISHSSDTQTSVSLKKLARGPIFTVVTYQGYDTNGYTFYTEHEDKKSMYQNTGINVNAYDATG
jgi:pyridoxine/pyridoxamine 5'-phosphate oxidase